MKKVKPLRKATSAKRIIKNAKVTKTVSANKTKQLKRKKAGSLKYEVGSKFDNALNENALALPYRVSESRNAARHFFLHKDNDECALTISNIPPFLKLNALEDMLNQLLSPAKIESLEIFKSSSLDGDLSKGYRSGIVRLCHVNDRRNLWKLCRRTPRISLGDASVCEANIERSISAYNAKFIGVEQMLLSVNEAVASYENRKAMEEKEAMKATGKPDDDGWITVTKNGKHSFCGKVNRQVVKESNEDSDDEEAHAKKPRKTR